MKKFIVKFTQSIRNAQNEIVSTISSEVDMEAGNSYQAFTNAPKFLLGLLPDSEIEIVGVTSTKPRKEKEVVEATTVAEATTVEAPKGKGK